MATITENISASDTVIPTSEELAIGFYSIDSENIYVTGSSRGAEGRAFDRLFASINRAVGGSTAATHTSGATLTRYYPDAATGAAVETVVYSQTVTLTDAQVKALNSTPIIIVPATETLDYVGTPTTIPVPVRMVCIVKKPTFEGYVDAAGTATLKFTLGALNDGVSYSEEDSSFLENSGGNEDMRIKWFKDNVGNLVHYGLGEDMLLDNAIRFGASADNPFTGGNAGNSLTVTVLYVVMDVG